MMLAEYERIKNRISAEILAEKNRHEQAVKDLRDEYKLADEAARLLINGIDDKKVLLAEHVIFVDGQYAEAGEDRAIALEDAVNRILDGGIKLKNEYVGTKSYAHWYGQHASHPYGMGPKHGGMIFEIGLTKTVRTRDSSPLLNEEEIDAAIYYLRNIERIQYAKKEAKTAAAVA